MVFQDFDLISERRRLERERRFKKRVTIAGVSVFLLLVVVAVGCFVIVSDHQRKKESNDDRPQNVQSHQKPKTAVSRVQKVINIVCNSTTYKDRCLSSLDKEVKKNPSVAHPKAVLRLAIQATTDQFQEVSTQVSSLKFDSPKEKAALEDCMELIHTAQSELKTSISHAGVGKDKILKNEADLNNWLSAVMSYQQTCIDGFPEGKSKTDMEKAFNSTKELTSNSLAVVSAISEFFSTIQNANLNRRRLLEQSEDDLPGWMSHEDRRMLKKADSGNLKPDVVVAKDGSGKFKTISAALEAMPAKPKGRYVIYVKQGVYDETVLVKKPNVVMYGDGSQKTIITGNKNFVDGVQTFRTASFAATGDGFMAKAIGFRNTAGPEKHQAVAARVQADRAIFLNCRFEGYQDTLYAQTHRQFYRSCVITGTIDFIFGDAAAILQNCLILVRKPLANQQNIITAQGRIEKHETTGIVLQNCKIQADKDLIPDKKTVKTYLGRPWKEYSRTIVMESAIDDLIHPDGWLPWQGEFGLKTLYYAEYKNTGAGAKTDGRVKWPGYHIINKEEANKFTVQPFLQGQDWITPMDVPVHFGLF